MKLKRKKLFTIKFKLGVKEGYNGLLKYSFECLMKIRLAKEIMFIWKLKLWIDKIKNILKKAQWNFPGICEILTCQQLKSNLADEKYVDEEELFL